MSRINYFILDLIITIIRYVYLSKVNKNKRSYLLIIRLALFFELVIHLRRRNSIIYLEDKVTLVADNSIDKCKEKRVLKDLLK